MREAETEEDVYKARSPLDGRSKLSSLRLCPVHGHPNKGHLLAVLRNECPPSSCSSESRSFVASRAARPCLPALRTLTIDHVALRWLQAAVDLLISTESTGNMGVVEGDRGELLFFGTVPAAKTEDSPQGGPNLSQPLDPTLAGLSRIEALLQASGLANRLCFEPLDVFLFASLPEGLGDVGVSCRNRPGACAREAAWLPSRHACCPVL